MNKSYIVDSTCNDMRLDRWLRLKIGKIPQGLIEKYLRTGKSARITEKIKKKIGIDVESKPEEVTEENLAPVVEEKTVDKTKTSEDIPEAPKAETKKEETKKDTPEEKK